MTNPQELNEALGGYLHGYTLVLPPRSGAGDCAAVICDTLGITRDGVLAVQRHSVRDGTEGALATAHLCHAALTLLQVAGR